MFGMHIQRATQSLRARSLLFVTLLTGGLAGPATASDLDKFNPATTDPEVLRIAVGHTERLKIPADGAKMVVLVTDKKTGRVVTEKKIILQQTETAEEIAEIRPGKDQDVISVYRIPTRHIDELRTLQAKYLALAKSEREAIAGTLSVDVFGCKLDPDDDGEILISTFMKTSELKDYVVIAKDYDLRTIPSREGKGGEDPVRPC